MSDIVAVLLPIVVVIVPLLLSLVILLIGLIAGQHNERLHFEELDRREADTADMVVTNLKSFPGAVVDTTDPTLVVGEVTIASDRMKNWLAGWRNLFGGEVGSYESLQRRARREARLRVVEQAKAAGFNAVGNIRLEGVDVGGAAHAAQRAGGRRPAAMVSVLAHGTAYHLRYDE